MNPRSLTLVTLSGLLWLSATANATAAPRVTLLNMIAEPLLEEKFTGPAFPIDWKKGAGDWSVAEGTLHGSQRTADHHIAFFYRMMPLPNPVVIRLEVRFEGNEVFAVAFNGTRRQDDHLFVVTVAKDAISVAATNSKFDPDDRGGKIASAPQTLAKGAWHTVTIEIRGNELVAFVDPRQVLHGRHDKIGRAIGNFGLRIGGADGQFGSIDNLRIDRAKPNPAWPPRPAALK